MAGEASSFTVPLVIGQVNGLLCAIGIEAGPNDSAAGTEQAAERVEHRPGLLCGAEQAQIVTHENGRIKERRIGVCELPD